MNFDGRCANAGVNNLTILRLDDGYRFLMMSRGTGFAQPGGGGSMDADVEHGAVASAMGATHVIPAGEFQPSSMSAVRDQTDCTTIWSTLMREFAEEILLYPEAKSQGVRVFDFERVEPFSLMIAAARGADPMAFVVLGHHAPRSIEPEARDHDCYHPGCGRARSDV